MTRGERLGEAVVEDAAPNRRVSPWPGRREQRGDAACTQVGGADVVLLAPAVEPAQMTTIGRRFRRRPGGSEPAARASAPARDLRRVRRAGREVAGLAVGVDHLLEHLDACGSASGEATWPTRKQQDAARHQRPGLCGARRRRRLGTVRCSRSPSFSAASSHGTPCRPPRTARRRRRSPCRCRSGAAAASHACGPLRLPSRGCGSVSSVSVGFVGLLPYTERLPGSAPERRW